MKGCVRWNLVSSGKGLRDRESNLKAGQRLTHLSTVASRI